MSERLGVFEVKEGAAAAEELGQHRAPLTNVYLCGAGSHPGSGVTMGPGRIAAQVISGDPGLAFPSAKPGL